MTLYEKSLRTLELPAVLQKLADEAVSQTAKDAALALLPVADVYEARYRLEETTAARTMMNAKGAPGFTGVRDIRASVRRADIGGMLNTTELLEIASLLRCAAEAVAYSGDRAEKTVIDHLFFGVRANKYLENKISGSIIGQEEIADAASAELADIRRHMRVAGDKIRTSLNRIITSPTYQKALQEPIITVKNDRYVVPVKADHKSSVPGLVHDISSSGATLFIEPMGVVQINNEIRELMAKEKQEIDRILIELSAEVASFGADIVSDFETLAQLDLIFAKAKLSQKQNAHEPELVEDGGLVLRRCRHPLLESHKTVPTDLKLGGEFDTLVITGPNTGGKTVALKTLGLFCAMAQCGLHIPAESDSRMPVFTKILADVGDEQSIEQSLSTFSSHMTNIVKILAECEPGTLLLFDELGAGTDPVEGAALARSIIEYARRRGSLVAATTHYSELKIYALAQKGVENASCEFDVETLRPTYRLLIGVPGRSNAFAISERLGLPKSVIADASDRLSGETATFEEAVGHLEKARHDAENDRDEAYKLRATAERDARIAEKYRAELERDREKLVTQARRDTQKLIDETRAHADAIIEELREIRRAARDDGEFSGINEAVPDILRELNEMEGDGDTGARDIDDLPDGRHAKPGDRVRLLKFDTLADVISVNGNTLELQAGSMKISAKADEVRMAPESAKQKNNAPAAPRTSIAAETRASVAAEIDLRGMMSDEAIAVMERYLDSARLANLETVTIIHGKGTGALRAAVQAALKREPFVKSFRPGRFGEGEMGVTVVELK
ncbi:MAG: endonuclease MutS2 [Oscillospiraceae bacterium]|jgi:DNA mismatch repair protein MutS2|nr:endonuclease MutS2 [Oscillospiraceae bacterium]